LGGYACVRTTDYSWLLLLVLYLCSLKLNSNLCI